MTIKPIGNRLVVELVKQKTTTASGIILSTKEENEQSIGIIIALGNGADLDSEMDLKETGLKVGDKIIFGKYSGEEIKDEPNTDTVYKILKAGDVMGIVE
jgi:chaperonin GroES